jgi:small-conductance mechanosensitive channel
LTNLKKELAEKTDQIDKLSKENAELKSQSNAKPIITTEGLKNAFEKLVEQSNKNAKDNEALNEQLKKIEAENKENGYQADFWKKKYESLSVSLNFCIFYPYFLGKTVQTKQIC